MVAPTTAPKEPIGVTSPLAARSWASTEPATVSPDSVRACCSGGASGLEVSASTKTPAPWAAAVSRM